MRNCDVCGKPQGDTPKTRHIHFTAMEIRKPPTAAEMEENWKGMMQATKTRFEAWAEVLCEKSIEPIMKRIAEMSSPTDDEEDDSPYPDTEVDDDYDDDDDLNPPGGAQPLYSFPGAPDPSSPLPPHVVNPTAEEAHFWSGRTDGQVIRNEEIPKVACPVFHRAGAGCPVCGGTGRAPKEIA